jgi:prolyl oligopeptidase
MKRGTWIAVCAAFLLAATAKGADSVDDPYAWLEDVHGAKPLAWVAEQNTRATAMLKADPSFQKDYDAVLKILDATDRIPYPAVDHGVVFNFWQDAANPKGVWRKTTVADYATASPHWEVLVDVDKLSADEKENWVWKGADCLPAQDRCLLNLSRGGGDAVVVREFDIKSRSFVKGGFELAEAKSNITWLNHDTVLFGTDFGPGSMTTSGYPRIVKLWQRGRPMASAKTIHEGKMDDVGVSPLVYHTPDGELPLIVRNITFFTTAYDFVGEDGKTVPLPLPEGADLKGEHGGNLIFTLRDDWTPAGGTLLPRGSLVVFNLKEFVLKQAGARYTVLTTPDVHSSIGEVATGQNAIFATEMRDVISTVHEFRPTADGKWSDTALPLPPNGTVTIIGSDDWTPNAYFLFQNYTTPPTLFAEGGAGAPKPIKSLPARFDASKLQTEQFFATSADGTRVPYFVTRPKGLTGPAPAVLYGYGGFEISQVPGYSTNFGKLWLEKGGVFVVANIRGGGEYGPAWHQAALKENRQRAFDDFAAVAADIEKRGITTPRQLGIMGGSNGGLLVSTVMTQHPELLGAVVCQVPLIDMIAYTHIGAGASWEAEYGDPAKPDERAYILKYSPYQNVFKDKAYPPVLFTTATSDDRVTPVHARKMAARMEEQGHDVLFFENTDGGHGAAANHKQSAEMWALSFVFLRQKLGLH